MSLQESWRLQRQQRQQEIAQRQQVVNQFLATNREQRLNQASQLRSDLSLFREAIAMNDASRRSDFQEFQSELERFCAQLRAETRSFLTEAGQHRAMTARKLSQDLDLFMQMLRQQTAQLLSIAAIERRLMAQQLEKELTTFVSDLRSDVQSYLLEMETARYRRAEELSQELQQSRRAREAEMQAIFQQLAKFRGELRQFCQSLRQSVWADQPVTSAPSPAPVVASKPKPVAKPMVALSVPVAPVLPATIGAFRNGDEVSVVPAQPSKVPAKDTIAYEKDVYNYIHQAHGARLTEIESSLGINRFQAVDALRLLIKKGMITQRDRIYLAQEDLAHT